MPTIAVAGDVPFDAYFRHPFLLAGWRHQCATFYIQWQGLGRLPRLTTFTGGEPHTVRCSLWQLARQLPGLDLLIFNYPLRPVARGFVLQRLLRPRQSCWDYFDDYYYGRKTWPKILLTRIWQRMCDRVLVLSPTLVSRFSNALHWDNASDLTPQRGAPREKKVVGTIASLDDRFDCDAYRHLVDALPGYRFHLYGRIHNYRNRNTKMVRRFEAWLSELAQRPHFRYFGAYRAAQLQTIVNTFDVGLIPYRIGPQSEHVNPDKYYHYTNAGVPVISAPIPSLRFRGNVVFYNGGDDLVERVIELVERRPRQAVPVRFEWSDRLSDLLHALGT